VSVVSITIVHAVQLLLYVASHYPRCLVCVGSVIWAAFRLSIKLNSAPRLCVCSSATLSMAATVDNVLALRATNSLSSAKKLELKELYRDQPAFSFTGRRQCGLLEHYSKLPWFTGCSLRKSLFCFPCLIYKKWMYILVVHSKQNTSCFENAIS